MPPNQPSPQPGQRRRLLWASSMRAPRPRRAYLACRWTDHIVLYRRILKPYAPVRPKSANKFRLTIIHELGHYFGWNESQLKDVSHSVGTREEQNCPFLYSDCEAIRCSWQAQMVVTLGGSPSRLNPISRYCVEVIDPHGWQNIPRPRFASESTCP